MGISFDGGRWKTIISKDNFLYLCENRITGLIKRGGGENLHRSLSSFLRKRRKPFFEEGEIKKRIEPIERQEERMAKLSRVEKEEEGKREGGRGGRH